LISTSPRMPTRFCIPLSNGPNQRSQRETFGMVPSKMMMMIWTTMLPCLRFPRACPKTAPTSAPATSTIVRRHLIRTSSFQCFHDFRRRCQSTELPRSSLKTQHLLRNPQSRVPQNFDPNFHLHLLNRYSISFRAELCHIIHQRIHLIFRLQVPTQAQVRCPHLALNQSFPLELVVANLGLPVDSWVRVRPLA
jgi:hypothetical protein